MNKPSRTLRKTANGTRLRRESSAPQARQLVFDLIERTPKSAAAERVERILELLAAAEESRVAILRDGLKGGRSEEGTELIEEAKMRHRPLKGFSTAMPLLRFADEAIEERNRQFREALRELQSLLIRYSWRPTVEDRLYRSLGQRLLWDRTNSADTEENRAVQFLLEQIDGHNGPARILRFRRCRECARWFYAVKDHQIYCGESCRKRHAAHGQSFKEKRRLYMKKYRSDEAERDARAKRLAKGKSK
jgi:hypothetical protein